jgi:hypothetical protein
LTNENSCWVLSDGNAGNENPCLGLAEAIGCDITTKRISARPPWSWLPPGLWLAPLSAPAAGSDPLEPPWPDLLIACGRQTAAPAAAIGRASKGHTFTVQLLDPRMAPEQFGLVVAPRHDRLGGANVIATLGALNRVTPERLTAEAERVASSVAVLPTPRVAVLVGGSTKRGPLTSETIERLANDLVSFAKNHGAGLMVTTSRRTGEANSAALRRRLDEVATVMWDGAGDNPYFGYLGLADAIIVTSDSVAMTSEACATGKPVYVYSLPGGSAKFERFHQGLEQAGCARRFDGSLENWRYAPLRETDKVAAEVRQRLDDRG